MGRAGDRVRFNVGGKVFETTASTIAGAGRDSMLPPHRRAPRPDGRARAAAALPGGPLLRPPRPRPRRQLGPIRREPPPARRLCPRPRPRRRHRHPRRPRRRLLRCPRQHGSRPQLDAGGAPPISLDYQRVNDVGYIDSDKIVITACERLGKGGEGGMGLFCSSTGELRHRFQVEHQNQVKSFTAGALGFGGGSDRRIFAGCKGRCNEYGIGVWDQVTGRQTDFFYESPGSSLGDADKVQWLAGSSCLMVATLFPKTEHCYIGLLDFREKRVVWSWSDAGAVASSSKRVLDAIAMEESRSICVVNQYDDLGFMDLRGGGGGGGLRWSSRSRLMKGKMPDEEMCYPKLAAHGGQLFSSMNDSISVFCGPEWVLTSRLRRSYGGSICDFSIGGERLFALHSEENVFDVWETPPSAAAV